MAAQGIVGGDAPIRHVVRVEWFGRDPGTVTIFVSPAGDGGTTPAVVEHDTEDDATRG